MSLNNTTKHPKTFKDRTGQRFGRLVVLEEAARPANGHPKKVYWRCLCDCGNVTIVDVDCLRRGTTRSCGCLLREVSAEIGRKGRKHGMIRTPEYQAWRGMFDRCYNPKSRDYAGWGGRGIIVCDRWHKSFENFYADMGPRPGRRYSIDRIDNDGPYSPDNCRWATYVQQNNNQRPQSERYNVLKVDYNGKVQSIKQWAKEAGLRPNILRKRLLMGWDMERAMTAPVRITSLNRHLR